MNRKVLISAAIVVIIGIITGGGYIFLKEPTPSLGREKISPPVVIESLKFQDEPSLGELTRLVFKVRQSEASRRVKNPSAVNIQVRVSPSENISVIGRKKWETSIAIKEEKDFTKNLEFESYGLHKISVYAGMNKSGYINMDAEHLYVNLTEKGVNITEWRSEEITNIAEQINETSESSEGEYLSKNIGRR